MLDAIARRDALALMAGVALFGAAAAGAAEFPPPPDRELRVTAPGGAIHVRVNGRLDGPRAPLVMAHGGPGGQHASFLPALAMAGERAVILYDQLDCGRSDAPGDPGNWVVERFVDEVEALRGALGLERFHLLGASWGGTIALEYAARRPKELLSVILQGPLVSTPAWIADAHILRARLPADVRRVLSAHEAAGTTDSPEYAAATDAFYARFWRREPPPAYIAPYEAALPMRHNRRLYETMWGPTEFVCTGTLKDYDGTPLLPEVEAPTLFLCGEYDESRPETCAGFAAKARRGELKVIAGAAHRIQTDRTAAWLEAIAGFVGRFG